MQHMIAVMLLDKTASFAAAHDKARMKDPAVLRQRAKVQLVPDEELERLYPKRIGVVEVTLTDGTHLTERVEDVRGTTGNPMPREEIIAKGTDLKAPFLGAAKCKRLIDELFGLEHVKDIRALRPLLQRA
jgi:2-methylcitrate dehydratase PrpD